MLEVSHPVRRFGHKVAVDDVSFSVEPGALTGFVGGNGAGKTMRMIMGAPAMHGGQVRCDGRPVTGGRPAFVRVYARGAGAVPEAADPRSAGVSGSTTRTYRRSLLQTQGPLTYRQALNVED